MMIRRAAPIVALAAMLVAAPVTAAEKPVTIKDSAFIDAKVRISLGDTVRWHNAGTFLHSTTGSAPLSLWTFDVASGAERTRTFRQAGTFAYRCRIHASMTGSVRVPLEVTPSSGTSATTFTIRVATINAPTGFTYMIQRKAPGGSFAAWKTTTAKSVTFKSSVKGMWRFRAQLKRTGNGAKSGFSPTDSVAIS